MKKTVYLLRHGEFLAQITREFSHSKVDYSLTEKGITQSQVTAKYLKNKGICAIYSSPLKRARETAKIISEELNLIPSVIEEFREVNVGSLEGKVPTQENWNIYNSIMRSWREGKNDARFPDGENHFELLARIQRGFSEVLQRSNECKNILVVAHGGILLATLGEICENTEDYDFATWNNCAITTVEFDDDEPMVGKLRGKVTSWQYSNHLGSQ